MKIVFFGSSSFAVPALAALSATPHKIVGVVTQPDRPKGRGLSLESTAVKRLAEELELKIYQAQKINTKEAIRFLNGLDADLFIVVAYGQILSREVLEIPKNFVINAHASLLPKYRGAAPINWALIRGENITGVSIIKMTEKMDAGPIILKKEIEIADEDTAITLEEKLSKMAAMLLIGALQLIEKNSYHLTAQDESKATLAPKLKKEDGLINWESSAQEIAHLIRGVLDWPGAFTYYKGKLLKIYQAGIRPLAVSHLPLVAGEILQVSKEGILVATGEDNLLIEDLQLEGKRRMTAGEFISGHKISAGEILGKKSIA